jgi:hypothetical protein
MNSLDWKVDLNTTETVSSACVWFNFIWLQELRVVQICDPSLNVIAVDVLVTDKISIWLNGHYTSSVAVEWVKLYSIGALTKIVAAIPIFLAFVPFLLLQIFYTYRVILSVANFW